MRIHTGGFYWEVWDSSVGFTGPWALQLQAAIRFQSY